jgi:small GTP-binding protein
MSQLESETTNQFHQAIGAIRSTLERVRGCTAEERQQLQTDVQQLNAMYDKITQGRVEIVIFGEISTGKSALINALIGRDVASVDVQGGWTKEVWGTTWEGAGHRIHGIENSELVLVDTPGINEVGGVGRAELAEVTARKADLILFVVDSDINEVEYSSLVQLAAVNKPIILVLNKKDLYSPSELDLLRRQLQERVAGLVPTEQFVAVAAHPRQVEYVMERPDGSSQSEWRRPPADVIELKTRILEVLEREGLGLIALNAAMYAADKSDRIATVRVQMRKKNADRVIWGMAATKALVVALTPVPVIDVVSGLAIDATTIVTLSRIYGLNFSMAQSRELAKGIAKAAGVFALGELTNWGASLFKGLTATLGTALTIIPQGAAAGFSSYIIGRAAQHYFEHGGSWGPQSPKQVVKDILATTDRDSVMNHLKDEIRSKLNWNRHAGKK